MVLSLRLLTFRITLLYSLKHYLSSLSTAPSLQDLDISSQRPKISKLPKPRPSRNSTRSTITISYKIYTSLHHRSCLLSMQQGLQAIFFFHGILVISLVITTERKDNLPQPAGNDLPNTVQEAVDCFYHWNTLLIQVVYWPGFPGPFLQKFFPSNWSPKCIAAWGYPFPGAALGISFCGTSGHSCYPIFPTYYNLAEWLVYRPLVY